MAEHYNCRLAVNDLTIKCCHCYGNYWKNVKKSEKTELEMDCSIEKNKSIPKFVTDENLLIHYCYVCLKKTLFNKQYLIVKSVEWLVFEGENKLLVAEDSCTASVLRGKKEIEDVCSGCVFFLIERFSPSDVVIIK